MQAILIDDEQLALDFLERQINKVGHVTVAGKFTNPREGLDYIKMNEPEIVFLDINMPETNGLEVAEKIQNKKPNINVVFVTAYDEYAVTAFELNALDYIVKPIQLSRLEKTIHRIIHSLNSVETPASPPQLYVNVCQQLLIGENKDSLAVVSWRTTKAKELFLYLLQNEQQLVSKSFLAELLWPNLNTEKSFAQLYTTIYHVRSKLKEFNGYFTIKSSMESYILNTENTFIDIHQWEKQLRSLAPVSKQTIKTYEEIMVLNHAPYLEEYEYLWIEAERYKYEKLWLTTALHMGEYYYNEGLFEQAIHWYQKVNDRHPTSEDAHLALMMIYDILGRDPLVKRQYTYLTNVLDEELGVSPSNKIGQWYGNWEKQMSSRK